MKRHISTATLNKRLPAGFSLPREFGDFLAAAAATDPNRHGWFDIKWSNPFAFGLKREVRAELVPFLRLGDGGFVTFWLRKTNTPAAIVHLDSEGGSAIVAENFGGFLARLVARKTGVPDIDDAEEEFPFSSVGAGKKFAAPKVAVISHTLRADFAKWIKSAADTHAPQSADASDLEKLRKQIHKAATAMLRDKNISPYYTARSSWWSLDLYATRMKSSAIRLAYRDQNKFKPIPAVYSVTSAPLITTLLGHVKHPKRHSYEIHINKVGLVSVDKDRELALQAPKK